MVFKCIFKESINNLDKKILLLGGDILGRANLVTRLKARGCINIIAIDQHRKNLTILPQSIYLQLSILKVTTLGGIRLQKNSYKTTM